MEFQHLAIASVPIQAWGQTYDESQALNKGTVFQKLDMPFFAADDGDRAAGCCGSSRASDPVQREREELMLKICQASFAADDLRLYLDTHPQDTQALGEFREHLIMRRQLLKEFAQRFYPLTLDCMAEHASLVKDTTDLSGCYCWQKGAMPWEGACV